MFTLSQVGRGAVLLMSMAFVACYIDVYTTGKFPWQHAAAESSPLDEVDATWSERAQAAIPWGSASAVLVAVYPEMRDHELSEVEIYFAMSGSKSDVHGNRVVAQALYGTANGNDSAVQQAQHTAPIFLPGSKSDVAAGAIVVQSPSANAPATPIFLSGTKSFSGQTTVLSGTLNTPSANAQSEQKAPAFMGGSKTIMLPTRFPETAQPRAVTPTQSPQFMGGTKSPGVMWPPGKSDPSIPPPPPPLPNTQTTPTGFAPTFDRPSPSGTYPTTYPQTTTPNLPTFKPNVLPQQTDSSSNSQPIDNTKQPPLFMSGAKSPIREVPKDLFYLQPPVQKSSAPNAMLTAPPPAPLQIAPKVTPNAPAQYPQATPRYYGDKLGSPAGSY